MHGPLLQTLKQHIGIGTGTGIGVGTCTDIFAGTGISTGTGTDQCYWHTLSTVTSTDRPLLQTPPTDPNGGKETNRWLRSMLRSTLSMETIHFP